jgi:putative membrane protein insertion efficiency factor
MLKKILISIIRIYQYFISPLLGQTCKYYPSCSNYFVKAVETNGLIGVIQGAYRIIRCNPYSYGGYDPVKKIKLF